MKAYQCPALFIGCIGLDRLSFSQSQRLNCWTKLTRFCFPQRSRYLVDTLTDPEYVTVPPGETFSEEEGEELLLLDVLPEDLGKAQVEAVKPSLGALSARAEITNKLRHRRPTVEAESEDRTQRSLVLVFGLRMRPAVYWLNCGQIGACGPPRIYGIRSIGRVMCTLSNVIKKFEKCGRMSSSGGERAEEGKRDVDQLNPELLAVIRKHNIENLSRTEGAMVRRNESIIDENEIT
jgi:hypothetical protein